MTFYSQFTPYSFPLLGLVRFPEIKITAEDKAKVGLKSGASNLNYLKTLIWAGYKTKLASGQFKGFSEEVVKDRLRMEVSVFAETGTVDYFLLLWDIAKWCDEQGILRGRGRGSSGGALSLHFLNIIDINALEHGLHFSRFLSQARLKPKIIDGVVYVDGKSAPDVDTDFQYLRRPEVIRYIDEKYPGHTCKISTRLQLTGKMALKDAIKTYLEYDDSSAKHISDMVESQFGTVDSLSKAIEKNKDLAAWVAEKPENKRAFDIARQLENLNVARGQHPSGVFISYAPLDGNVPVEMSKNKEVVTSNDMQVSATQGVKYDALGIRTLDALQIACDKVGIKPNDIDVNHPSIYEYYAKTDLYGGLFQIESGLTKEGVRKIIPRNIDELASCLAISRPGSLKHMGQLEDYVQKGIFKSIHPVLDEILRPTGGVILFQETITEVCQKMFGMDPVSADTVRYNVGKKLKDEMKKIEPILYEKGRANGVPEDIIKYFWDTCNASADYLFVKAHAYEYAYLTAQTTYVKANHPREFIFALLTLSRHEPDSQTVLNNIIKESKQMGINVLPPDITKSEADFTIEPDGVRFGLSHIRGISDTTMSKLVSFKRDFPDKFALFSGAKEAGLTIGVLQSLIMSGCVNIDKTPRTKLAVESAMFNELTQRERDNIIPLFAAEYNYDLIELLKGIQSKVDEKGKPYIKPSRMETYRRDIKSIWAQYQANAKHEELASYLFERHLIGFSYSGTLYGLFSKKVEGLIPIGSIAALNKGEKVSFVAFVDDFKKAISLKNKKPYIRFVLSDESGTIKGMLNGNKIDICEQFNGKLPETDDIVIFHGSYNGEGLVFGDQAIIQQVPVQIKKTNDTK
jgi:DNA-directed DNA polymerase III PolC